MYVTYRCMHCCETYRLGSLTSPNLYFLWGYFPFLIPLPKEDYFTRNPLRIRISHSPWSYQRYLVYILKKSKKKMSIPRKTGWSVAQKCHGQPNAFFSVLKTYLFFVSFSLWMMMLKCSKISYSRPPPPSCDPNPQNTLFCYMSSVHKKSYLKLRKFSHQKTIYYYSLYLTWQVKLR